MDSPVEAYVRDLRRTMRGQPLLARRVAEEARDHLAEIVAAERRAGMSQHEAEQSAVGRFGAPDALARQFDRFSLPFQALLAFSAIATVLVAVWLFTVVAWILPARDPARIPMWTIVAIGFLAYSVLSLAYLVVGPRSRLLRAVVLLLSVVAIVLGGFGVVDMLRVANAGGHFEGYILLMGIILAGHGLVAIAYTLLSAVIARRIRAV